MSDVAPPRAYLIFTGSGPILILSTYPSVSDPDLVAKLRYKGIGKFLAYEVDRRAAEGAYPDTYGSVAADLEDAEDLRVLDFNGHQIMANFSLEELGEPVKVG